MSIKEKMLLLEISDLQQKLRQLKQKNIQLKQELAERLQAEKTLKQVNKKLQYLSKIDSLTGIANRRQLTQSLKQEWRILERENSPLSVIMIDVDYFKLYNDNYGHQKGDCCLQQIAQAISSTLERPADLVTRYGGEEFVVILPRTDLAGTWHVANKIKIAIKKLNIIHEFSPISKYVTISQGITSTIPTSGRPAKSIICVADQALYQAKKQGRNQIVELLNCKSKSLT